MRSFLLILTIGLAATPAFAASSPSAQSKARPPAPKTVPVSAPTKTQIAAAKKQGKTQVKLETTKGVILLEVDGAAAPIAVANFLNLVRAGFYSGMPFHRVEPGFVIQAGDPALVKRPPVTYTLPDEKSPIKHLRGTIAMARSYLGGQMVPNSASTQFYITLSATPHLDQIGFTAFGKVIGGMEVVDKIVQGDRITRATVLGKPGRKAR
jgi:peptidyl-prolyl cis-trans isomerase B (cyclophilin B)